MNQQTNKALRVRCPRARRPTDPEHVVRDIGFPIPGNDFDGLLRQIGRVCQCGARIMLLSDNSPEYWDAPMSEADMVAPEPAEDPQVSEDPPVSAPLEPLTPDQIRPLCDSPDPTINLLAKHLLYQTAYLGQCSDALSYAQDAMAVLCGLVIDRDPEALVMARDHVEMRPPEITLTGIRDGWLGFAAHAWATRVFAVNFGKTLGPAPNLVEMKVTSQGRPMTITIRRENGKTAMDLLGEANAELASVRGRIEDIPTWTTDERARRAVLEALAVGERDE
jgi:hypothetical protein